MGRVQAFTENVCNGDGRSRIPRTISVLGVLNLHSGVVHQLFSERPWCSRGFLLMQMLRYVTVANPTTALRSKENCQEKLRRLGHLFFVSTRRGGCVADEG